MALGIVLCSVAACTPGTSSPQTVPTTTTAPPTSEPQPTEPPTSPSAGPAPTSSVPFSPSVVSPAERLSRKMAATLASVPDSWTAEISETSAASSTDIYAECAETGGDVLILDNVTLAVSTLDARAPMAPNSFLPGAHVALEMRILESPEVAANAFEVITGVLEQETGRQCLSERFGETVAEGLPGSSVVETSVDATDVVGAGAGASLVLTAEVDGLTYVVHIDVVAERTEDTTVYGTFTSFGDPFEARLLEALFDAAMTDS